MSRIYPQPQQQHEVAVFQTRHVGNVEEEVWVLTASKHLALRPALTPVHWQHRFVAGFPPAGVSVMWLTEVACKGATGSARPASLLIPDWSVGSRL